MIDQTDVITHRVVYDTECSNLVASIDKALHDLCQLVDTDSEHVAQEAHDNLHALSERLVDNELAHDRAMAEGGWQDIASAPKTDEDILVLVERWEGWNHVQEKDTDPIRFVTISSYEDQPYRRGFRHRNGARGAIAWMPLPGIGTPGQPLFAPPTPTTEAESRT